MKLLFVGGTRDGHWRDVELKIIQDSSRRVRLPKIKDAEVADTGGVQEPYIMENEEYKCHTISFPYQVQCIYIMAEESLGVKDVFKKLINNYKV